ncbi:hypothetical protein BGX38DRAFT_1230256 [Terfezia claveryi]|nr:hypothetical protein BGX38DRAFT_1230256 [Terfezia claveryi]
MVGPLISLLRDQVKATRALGREADGIDGTSSESTIEDVCTRLQGKRFTFYSCPWTTFCGGSFETPYPNTPLMLVIDEVYLIPLEEPKFRTSYLDLTSFNHRYLPQRLLLTTAATTEEWLQDPFQVHPKKEYSGPWCSVPTFPSEREVE